MQFEIFRPVTVFDIFLFDFSISISIILKISDPGKQMMNSLSCKVVKNYEYTYLLDEIWSKCVFVYLAVVESVSSVASQKAGLVTVYIKGVRTVSS